MNIQWERRGKTILRCVFLNDHNSRRANMSESVYKIIEMVGSSPVSWEQAAQNAVKAAGLSLRDLRIAEVKTMDMVIKEGQDTVYRVKVNLSFKILSD